MPPVVVLVGPPGAGKSTVATLLAERLGHAVRDTDADVVASTGSEVADLFVDRGEAEFRRLEAAAVERALLEHDGVLALGGGAVLDERTRTLLSAHRVVLLDVGLAHAVRRVGVDGARPLLLGNVRSQLRALLEARRPLYVEVARHVVRTDDRSPQDVADEVTALLEHDPHASPTDRQAPPP